MHALALALCLFMHSVVAPPAGDMCVDVRDRDVCGSRVCPGYAWCELCDKCLYAEVAVTKDEL